MHDEPLNLGRFPDGTDAWLSQSDRRRHVYAIGKSGGGKSTLLRNMMVEDLHAGRGFSLLDPHGDLAMAVAGSVPSARTQHVIYLDPSDPTHHAGINPLNNVAPDQRPVVAANIVSAFDVIWETNVEKTPRLVYLLTNSLRLLLDAPGSTLLGLTRLLTDARYRTLLLGHCRDPIVRDFWVREFAEYSDRYANEAIAPVLTRVGTLLSPFSIRNMLGQVNPTIDVARVMDERKILIVNLAHGRLGEAPTHLLGAFFATAFAQAAQARAAIMEDERRDHTLYADEFQHFASDSFVSVLSEARKYRLSLVLAHQFLGQCTPLLRQAIIGNAGSLLAFRLGAEDAELIAAELGIDHAPTLCDTAVGSCWAKLLRDGNPTDPRPITTHLLDGPNRRRFERIVARSRNSAMRPRAAVEAKLARFYAARSDQ